MTLGWSRLSLALFRLQVLSLKNIIPAIDLIENELRLLDTYLLEHTHKWIALYLLHTLARYFTCKGVNKRAHFTRADG